MLLARGNQLRAVRVLHAEISQTLSQANQPNTYTSQRDGEERQRELVAELFRQRAEGRRTDRQRTPSQRTSWLALLRNRWHLWVSWLTVAAMASGLSIRYAYAVFQLALWQREHPNGNWISRYYETRRFAGTPVVRYDNGIDYNWRKEAPAQTLPRDYWAASWDTCVVAASDLKIRLSLVADHSAKLMLDDVPQIEVRSPGRKAASVRLRAGVRHLRVEYQDRNGSAKVRLEGLDFAGTESYRFQRPVFAQGDAHCEGPSAAHASRELHSAVGSSTE
jgi:hypothetical protein